MSVRILQHLKAEFLNTGLSEANPLEHYRMPDLVKMGLQEQKAIEELRARMKKCLSLEMYDDTNLFYRFLKARDFDVEKAEVMLRKNLRWRKVVQLDTLLGTLKPKEVFQRYFAPQFVGFDKVGDIVIYAPVGNMDTKDALKCFKMNDFERHCIHNVERNKALLNEENEKSGRNCYQGIFIFNLDQLTIANASNKASAEILIRISRLLQDNYPERLKTLIVINAPSYYVFIYTILKKMMSNAMTQKIHVFGQNGWQELLLKFIDANVLPAFLGGNRTDPDGNPLCLTFLHQAGRVSPKYYLTDNERWFKDMPLVKKTIIPPMSKNVISVDVKLYGSCIEWEFECKSGDIEFGLFFQDNEHEIELLPTHRFKTSDGTETGSYKTESVGKYNIIFDNSYSWLSSKEVHYIVKVVNIYS